MYLKGSKILPSFLHLRHQSSTHSSSCRAPNTLLRSSHTNFKLLSTTSTTKHLRIKLSLSTIISPCTFPSNNSSSLQQLVQESPHLHQPTVHPLDRSSLTILSLHLSSNPPRSLWRTSSKSSSHHHLHSHHHHRRSFNISHNFNNSSLSLDRSNKQRRRSEVRVSSQGNH